MPPTLVTEVGSLLDAFSLSVLPIDSKVKQSSVSPEVKLDAGIGFR